jgi:hypothetical protein
MQYTSTPFREPFSLTGRFPQLYFLRGFVEKILQCQTLEEKLALLDEQGKVSFFFLRRANLYHFCLNASVEDNVLLKSLIIIDQAEGIFSFEDAAFSSFEPKLQKMLNELRDVESFYNNIGGLIGYHVLCLELIEHQQVHDSGSDKALYFPPKGIDLTEKNEQLHHYVAEGIKAQKYLAELYPVGGAADRLNLQDEKTHKDLPAARLEFLGRSLLEGMIRDVQAREYLYYKLHGEQISIPIGLMTSKEKNNEELISEIICQNHYFGKDKDAYKLFTQPLVPTLTQEGVWVQKEPMDLLLKPGGHGVIWKLAQDKGVFEWMLGLNKDKILVRQINNPIAGVDLGLTAFVGVGTFEKKSFGFASCKRRVKTSEGMNIIKITEHNKHKKIVLSSIEYCDFEKCGIEDVAIAEDQPYSVFPSNTNILYADIKLAAQAVTVNPYPGKVINFKKVKITDAEEEVASISLARLELLMQNLADAFAIEAMEEPLSQQLPVFMTFNDRHKTISPTKKEFVPGSGLVETAFGCFYDFLKNAKDLLDHYCMFQTPELVNEESFLQTGPSFMFNYHPALGPLYSVIGQKISQGKLCFGAELYLEIADVYFNHLVLDGSLIVDARQVLGHKQEHKVCFSALTGRCILKNVTIKNKGINRSAQNVYWKNKIEREETCYIQLQGYSEFIAENVVLEGDYHVIVRDGERVTAFQQGDDVIFKKESLDKKLAVSFWKYSFLENQEIVLEK